MVSVSAAGIPGRHGSAPKPCRFASRRRGYSSRVPEAETPGDLLREVDRGRSERTPFLALTGVTLVVAGVVAVVTVIVIAVYLLA